MRILYLNPTGSLGGAERVLLSVMAALRRSNPAADLHLLATAEGPLIDRATQLGVRAAVLPMPARLADLGDSQARNNRSAGRALLHRMAVAAPAVFSYARRFRKELRAIAPDLIHSNGIKTHLLAHLAGVREVPVIWHAHDFYGARPATGRLLRWARKRVAGVVAISEAVAQDVRVVCPGLPVHVVYNAVDVKEFSPAPGAGSWLDVEAGLPPGEPNTIRVGLVATYARWKGQDVLLEAATRLSAQRPPVPLRFFIIGGPIYCTRGSQFTETELRSMARQFGVENDVGFLGFQPNPVEAFRALDIVLHASTQPEPFGLTIAEAMACGRPLIAVQSGGAAELFHHGYDALGVPPSDPVALVAAIGQLIHNARLRQSLGENARRTALQCFNGDRLGPQFLAIYDSVRRRFG